MNKTDLLLLESLCNEYGVDAVAEALNLPPQLRSKVLPAAAAGLITLSGIAGLNQCKTSTPVNNVISTEQVMATDIRDEIPNYDELVDKVQEFMEWSVTRINHNIDEIQIDPEVIVQECYKNKFDIPTLLSWMHVESHCGVENLAVKTNSVFSQGLYDDGTITCTFETQSQSVPAFIHLIQKDYTMGKRSLAQLLQDGQLYNKNHDRYASNPKEERNIRATRAAMLNRRYPNGDRIYQVFDAVDFYNEIN